MQASRVPINVWVALLILHFPVVSAFEGDEFNNNLFSDLGPILALFGEQVTKQFMAGSTTWEENILLTMAPLGIITAVIAAIRIGGPLWLKAIIGRARENKATAEVELTTSTSEDVCELWNGSTIVRIMGAPKILELLYLPHMEKGSSLFTLNEGRRDGIFEPKKVEKTFGSWINNLIFSKIFKSSNPNIDRVVEDPEDPKPATGSTESTKPTLKQNAPSVFLNLKPPKGTWQNWELRLLAMLAIMVQAAVVIFWAFGTYMKSLNLNIKDLKGGSATVADYAFPISAGGTLLLIGGMTICAYIVDACTIEVFWPLKKEHKQARVLWLQQGGNINDQNFDSFAIFAKGKRDGIWTSWLSTSFHFGSQGKSELGEANERATKNEAPSKPSPPGAVFSFFLKSISRTRAPGAVDKATSPAHQSLIVASKPIQTLVIIGVVMATTGFVIQFTGLRAMHWSASIAQLVATGIMVIIRAWVRRDLVTKPATTYKILKDHELDWLATMLGVRGNRLWDQSNDSDGSSTRSDDKSDNDRSYSEWNLKRSVSEKYHCLKRTLPEIQDSENANPDIYTAQKVMKTRERLGCLSEWRGRSTEPAIALSNAIQIVMNSLLANTKLENDMLFWTLPINRRTQTRNIATQPKPDRGSVLYPCDETTFTPEAPEIITLSITRDAKKHWTVKASEIEAVLSLMLYSVENRAEKELEQAGSSASEKGEGDWLRQGNTESQKPTMRILGPKIPRYEKDLKWYLGSRMDQVMEVERLRTDRGTTQFSVKKPHGLEKPDIENFRVSDFRNELPPLEEPTGTGRPKSLGIISDTPLEIFYAQDLFASFMWAISTYIGTIQGETIARSSNSSWKDITVENSILSSMMKDIEKVCAGQALGSSDDIHQILLSPLSLLGKLPDPPKYLFSYALDLASAREKANDWNEATEIYTWLLEECEASPRGPKDIRHSQVRARVYVAAMGFRQHLQCLITHDQRPSTVNNKLLRSCVDRLKGPQGLRFFTRTSEILSTQAPEEPIRKEVKQLLACLHRLRFKPMVPKNNKWCRRYHQAVQNVGRLGNYLDLNPLHCSILELALKSKDEKLDVPDAHLGEYLTQVDCTGWTPLHYAVKIGHRQAVIRLSESGVINSPDIIGKTPLHYARTRSIGEILIDAGAQPKLQARDGSSPLHCAVIGGATTNEFLKRKKKKKIDEADHWIPMVNLLLEVGTDVDITDNARRTPLHWAAYLGDHELVKLLVEKGANVRARENHGKTPLHLATTKDHLTTEMFQDLERDFDFEAVDEEGSTPLYHALREKHLESAKILIRKKAGIEVPNVKDNRQRPLHLAIQQKLTQLVKLLVINAKADVNAVTSKGLTPLHMALENGLKDIVQILVDHGANLDVNIQNRDGETAIDLAVTKGYDDITAILIKNFTPNLASILNPACATGNEEVVRKYVIELGADLRQSRCETTGSTPLHRALEVTKANSIVDLLLNEGKANVNAKDYDGTAPIHLASKWGNENIIKKLLEKKQTEIDARDNTGWTALHHACKSNHKSCAKILVAGGASIEATTATDRYTPLHVASKHGRDEILEILITDGKAKLEARTKDGDTALHLASAAHRLPCVKALLDRNAEINALNGKRLTPLDVARSNPVSVALVQYGGKRASEL